MKIATWQKTRKYCAIYQYLSGSLDRGDIDFKSKRMVYAQLNVLPSVIPRCSSIRTSIPNPFSSLYPKVRNQTPMKKLIILKYQPVGLNIFRFFGRSGLHSRCMHSSGIPNTSRGPNHLVCCFL